MSDLNSCQQAQAPAFARFLFRVNVWAFIISITFLLALVVLVRVPTAAEWKYVPAFAACYLAAGYLAMLLIPVDLAFCIVVRAIASRFGERFTATLRLALWSLAMAFVAGLLFLSTFIPTL